MNHIPTHKLKIQHLRRNDINVELWNEAIERSGTSLPYACSWYLDAVSPNWEALILGNYQLVMPLTVKRKWGIKYIIQPRITQQLGVFGSQHITDDLLHAFFKKISYLSFDFNLNYTNEAAFRSLPNAIIGLKDNYTLLRKKYSSNCVRNVKKSQEYQNSFTEVDFQQFYTFWCDINSNAPQELVHKIPILAQALESNNSVRYFAIKTPSDELLSVLLLVVHGNRLIYLLPASSSQGKSERAMFLLVDSLIQAYASNPYILDFEGSQIEGVMRFYLGFGADVQPYYHVKRARPSWLVKLINP